METTRTCPRWPCLVARSSSSSVDRSMRVSSIRSATTSGLPVQALSGPSYWPRRSRAERQQAVWGHVRRTPRRSRKREEDHQRGPSHEQNTQCKQLPSAFCSLPCRVPFLLVCYYCPVHIMTGIDGCFLSVKYSSCPSRSFSQLPFCLGDDLSLFHIHRVVT